MKRMIIPLDRRDCEHTPITKSDVIVYVLACVFGTGLGLIYMGLVIHFARGS